MAEEMITFGELRKIQKNEKRDEELTVLDDDFMLKVSDYFSSKEDKEGRSREYRNAERVLEKIISLREDKIVRSAKISANAENGTPENLLPFENELFRQLRDAFSEHRELLEEKKNGKGLSQTETVDGRSEKEGSGEEEEGDEYVKLKIIGEVPEFMGTDLESYGPFEEGEEVKVPEDNAEILVNRGNAEELR